MKIFPTLFKRTKKGQIQQWTIIVDADTYYTEEGLQGGTITQSQPTICYGKNLGKKNETDPEQQAYLEAESKYLKKLKENYHDTIENIDNDSFFEPALCKQYEDHADDLDFVRGISIEDKLNGIRCTTNDTESISRKGEKFHCLNHIQEELKPFFEKYPEATLDGELFNPIYRNQLNKISKLVSVNMKEKDVTPERLADSKKYVQYHIYDGIGFEGVTKDTPYVDRKDKLKGVLMGLEYCFYHPYKIVHSNFEVMAELKKTKDIGSEGIVIKILDAPYKNGRSKNFLKLKNWTDEEFEILGFEEGTGNWTGCVKKVNCKLNKVATDGRTTFDSNIRGTMDELRDLWINREQHIGKKCTVVFQEYSEYGIPLIPYTELPFRDYE